MLEGIRTYRATTSGRRICRKARQDASYWGIPNKVVRYVVPARLMRHRDTLEGNSQGKEMLAL